MGTQRHCVDIVHHGRQDALMAGAFANMRLTELNPLLKGCHDDGRNQEDPDHDVVHLKEGGLHEESFV